jgi:fatty acid desaturase
LVLTTLKKRQIKSLAIPDWRQYYAWCTATIAGVIAVLYFSQASSWYVLPLYVFPLGVLQHRIALLFHEGCHINYTRWKVLNRCVTESLGWTLMTRAYGGYRDYHLQHHRNLGTNADPELSYRKGWGHKISTRLVLRSFLSDLMGFGVLSQFRFMWDVRPKELFNFLPMFVGWAAVVFPLWLLDWHKVYILWVLSLFTSFWAIFRVRAFFEHVGVPVNGKHTSHRFIANLMFRAVFFPLNTWCHYEHHLFPTVPFHNLPKLREILAPPDFKSVKSISAVLIGSDGHSVTEPILSITDGRVDST